MLVSICEMRMFLFDLLCAKQQGSPELVAQMLCQDHAKTAIYILPRPALLYTGPTPAGAKANANTMLNP